MNRFPGSRTLFLMAACLLVPFFMMPAETTERPFLFTARDGTSFAGLQWENSTIPPRAVVLAVHGISGAASDFRTLGIALPDNGYAVTAYNLRALGLDPVPKRRGHLKDRTLWYTDLEDVLQQVETDYPGLPVFLLGESMGALIAMNAFDYLKDSDLNNRIHGVVLNSPVVELQGELPWWQDWIARVLLLVAPGKKLDLENFGDPEGDTVPEGPSPVTRDAAYAEFQKTAPHRLTTYSLRFLKHIYDMTSQSFEAAQSIGPPLLVLYAGRDVFVSPEAVQRFVQSLPPGKTTARLFPDAYHLLYHDPDTPQVIQALTDWLAGLLS